MDLSRRSLSPVVAVGLGMVFLHVAFRAWALRGSWFYHDDFTLIRDARGSSFDLDYVASPYDQQFMPLGRALAWVAAQSEPLDWGLVTAMTTALVALSGLSCLWMLVTLFGSRWLVLAPLAVYLSSAMVLPATMWWAASLNQVPWQAAFFLAVGAWVRHLRTRSPMWLAATLLALVLGLAAYVKALLIFPVLVLLLLGWFLEGTTRDRVVAVVRRWKLSVGLLLLLGGGYAVFYRLWVPQPFNEPTDRSELWELSWTLLVESFGSSVVGGPWHWSELNPPVAGAAPPALLVIVAWVVIGAFVLTVHRRRDRSLRAVLLLLVFVLLDLALLAGTRAAVAGAIAATELRYLTDSLAVAVLVIGLMCLSLPGAPGSTFERTVTRFPRLWVPPSRATSALVALVVVGGLWSSWSYARVWHENNPPADYFRTILAESERTGNVTMVDHLVPADAYAGFGTNHTAYLLPLLSDRFKFRDSTDLLVMLDDEGELRRAELDAGVTSAGGTPGGCEWAVRPGSVTTVPLSASTFEWGWWAHIGYLASKDTSVTIEAGDNSVEADLQVGLNSIYVHLPGVYDEIEFSGLSEDANVCLGGIAVGTPRPGAPL